MDTFEADAVVIGAGAVGLACARALALKGREVLVLEAASAIATETSSRNSEVIHAGLYYPTGSLKARLCVEGRRKLYQYCAAHGVEAHKCGKLVVAVDDGEAAATPALLQRALANGVEETRLIDGAEARRLEPALNPEVRVAIHTEVSGLFDSHHYFLALQGEFEDRGGSLVLDTPVVRGAVVGDGIEIETGGASPSRIKARTVVNSAGHQALNVARSIEGGPRYNGVRMSWVKGSYFVASGRAAFARLIYPMHNSSTQGLHLAIDLGGRTRLGPDAEWLPEGAKPPFDYEVDPARQEHFYREVRRYWPGLKDGALSPDYSGVRPKIVGKGQPSADFMIDGPEAHGVAGLVNLIGIESPGLTSSLAIGEMVAGLV
ncbi:MAG TPA: NAD(P)/FAD-dependent oxidoreductase [Hyphomonadaceae bacterium]|nr:NAD(P)/FAD-dependent oxidoreductase [Hyphomonadaceae bacterium]HPN06548.1 NAD(P)/FAD-dependent oxidoreductase [Hyphomonadaceae bacterium]